MTAHLGTAQGGAHVGERQLTEQGAERRQQILDAAARLFAERGYGPTRVADICTEAGVAKGLFYWYFDSKQELFTDLVRTMRLELRRAQRAAMEPTEQPLARVHQGVMASMRFMAEHHSYFTLLDMAQIDMAGSDPAISDVLREGSAVYVADVERLVREAQAHGTVIDVDPRTLAVGVVGAVSSFGRAWRDGHVGASGDDVARIVADWVVRALTAPEVPPSTRRVP